MKHLETLSGFTITRHQLMLFGLCATCRAQAAPGSENHLRKAAPKGGPQETAP